MKQVRTGDLTARDNARIIKSAVSPRPIAWISTKSADGIDNLAPFSSCNYMGSRQPVVLFNSPRKESGRFKDTARNVLETGEFVINVVTEDLLEQMDQTSKRIPADESEFALAGIQGAECREVTPLRVAESVITLECTYYDSLEILERIMILGEVQLFHIDDEVLTDGKVDMAKIPTVGRLGGPYYTISDPVEFERQF